MNATRHFTFIILINVLSFLVAAAIAEENIINLVDDKNNLIYQYNNSEAVNNYADLLSSDTGGVNPNTGVFFNDPISWFLRVLRTLGGVLFAFVFPFASLLSYTSIPVAGQVAINIGWALYSIISLYAFVSNK